MKKIIKKRPILSGIIIFILVIIIGMLLFGGNGGEQETMVIQRTEFVSEVSASGKVVAAQAADLGFDQSGRIAGIQANVGDAVKAGQVIAHIENGTIYADITQKQAMLEKERANLAATERGTRSEELEISEQAYTDASSALILSMREAYLETEDAILNQIDTLFEHGNSVSPSIQIRTANQNIEHSIEQERLNVTEHLATWKQALAGIHAASSEATISSARSIGMKTVTTVQSFLDHLSVIVNNISPNNSGDSEETIDTYRTTVNGADQQVSTAASTEQTAYASWASARNTLNLDRSGSTAEDIAAQSAQVKSAEADLLNAQAQLKKTMVTAPFDGIVTKLDVKIGEIVSPGTSHISIMSAGTFEVESFIPEINVARIKVGDPADITLDAYGSNIVFPASIIFVDPAETLRDGVSTYKTRLRFTEQDGRIRSGMTANIRITTEKKPNVIVVPRSIIIDRDGVQYVEVKKGDATEEVLVTTGSSTGLGQTEITSGLNEGDVVVLPPLSDTK